MNILYVWDADYPWDIRTEKITKTFAENNHDVHIVCRNLNKLILNETFEGVWIHRLSFVQNNRLNKILSFPFPLNPLWLLKIIQVVKKNNIQVIFVRDLPISLAGIIIGKMFHIPVIFDMAEDYPAMLYGIIHRRPSIVNKLIRNPVAALWLENLICIFSDKILVVVKESMERLAKKGIPPHKIRIVSNTPSLQFIKQADNLQRTFSDKFNLLYIGGIQLGRGIQNVLNAMNLIIPEMPDIYFTVVGDGYALNILTSMSKELNVNSHVNFLGFINHKTLAQIIFDSDICIIPHYLNKHTLTTIPNKLFDYMAMGKPIIATDIPPITRIIKEEDCGTVFEDRNYHELAEKIMLCRTSGKLYEWGENGKKAVKQKYNWNFDKINLLNVIDN